MDAAHAGSAPCHSRNPRRRRGRRAHGAAAEGGARSRRDGAAGRRHAGCRRHSLRCVRPAPGRDLLHAGECLPRHPRGGPEIPAR
jgi:hypothetical protein